MKYEILPYQPEFKAQILELQTHLWSPELGVNKAYFEWKHEHNPYMDTPLIYVALYKGKVVGMRGMYGSKWQIGNSNKILSALCSCDLVIDPKHRNQGLFKKIISIGLDDPANMGYTYLFDLSPSSVVRFGSMTTGWRHVDSLKVMRWTPREKEIPFDSISRKDESELSILSDASKVHPCYFIDKNGTKRRGNSGPSLCVESTPRPEAMAELVESIGSDGRLRHVRDQQYFTWRFHNPLSLYRFIFLEGDRLEGYIVLQSSIYRNKNIVSIVDWEATTLAIRSEILSAALEWGKFDDVRIWADSVPEEVKTLLKSTGFCYLSERGDISRSMPTVLVRPASKEILKTDWTYANRQLLNLADWDLRMLYSDAF